MSIFSRKKEILEHFFRSQEGINALARPTQIAAIPSKFHVVCMWNWRPLIAVTNFSYPLLKIPSFCFYLNILIKQASSNWGETFQLNLIKNYPNSVNYILKVIGIVKLFFKCFTVCICDRCWTPCIIIVKQY